jgi:cytochrome c
MLNFRAAILATAIFVNSPLLAQAAPASDPAAGAETFKRCTACHKIGPAAANGLGPQLNGVVGRPAGSLEGYNYSNAMKNSGLTWDETTLAAFLRAPKQVVPRTKMTFPGLKTDVEVANVIAYLKQFGPDGAQLGQ